MNEEIVNRLREVLGQLSGAMDAWYSWDGKKGRKATRGDLTSRLSKAIELTENLIGELEEKPTQTGTIPRVNKKPSGSKHFA